VSYFFGPPCRQAHTNTYTVDFDWDEQCDAKSYHNHSQID